MLTGPNSVEIYAWRPPISERCLPRVWSFGQLSTTSERSCRRGLSTYICLPPCALSEDVHSWLLAPPPSSPIPADRASARLPKAEPPQRTMPRKPTFGCMGALRDQSATNLGFSGLGPGRRLASSAQCAEASPVAMGQNWTAGHAPQPRGHAAATLGDEHHTSVAAEVPSRILPIRSPDLPSRPTPCRQDGLP